ncbi:hypothetical protein ANTQUA_LOCUS5974, partial [Anthophora quadrimaculata]
MAKRMTPSAYLETVTSIPRECSNVKNDELYDSEGELLENQSDSHGSNGNSIIIESSDNEISDKNNGDEPSDSDYENIPDIRTRGCMRLHSSSEDEELYTMKGRTITTDNFFTSFPLALKLLSKNTSLFGTIRANKRELPKSCKQMKDNSMARSSTLLYESNEYTLTVYKSKRKEVLVLNSKIENATNIRGGNPLGASSNEDEKDKDNVIINTTTSDNINEIIKSIKEKGPTEKLLPKITLQINHMAKLKAASKKIIPTPNLTNVRKMANTKTPASKSTQSQQQSQLENALKLIETLTKTVEELQNQLKEERESHTKIESFPTTSWKKTDDISKANKPKGKYTIPIDNHIRIEKDTQTRAAAVKRPYASPLMSPTLGNSPKHPQPGTSPGNLQAPTPVLVPTKKKKGKNIKRQYSIRKHKTLKANTNSNIRYPMSVNYRFNTKDNYTKACDTLKTNNIQYYTYTPKSDKNFSILIKNLDGNSDTDTILDELRSKNIKDLNFISVKKFITKKSVSENKILPIYLVQLCLDSRTENLKLIKIVLHSLVYWEKLIKKDRVQCKRCQRIGHIALNCNLNYRRITQNTFLFAHQPTLLQEIKHITSSINNQISRIVENVEINTNRINFIAESLDILLLSETKLNQRHKIDFRNYTTIRTDRPNAKQAGGTAIIIKEEIAFKHIITQTTTCLESTIIEIKLQNAAKLYVVAGYATSSCDLNAKHCSWYNVINNSRGISLNKWIHENEIPYRISLYKTETPSFPKSGAFIDLCIADNRIKFHNTPNHRSLESFPYDSDHRAVKIQISIPTMQTLEIDETVTQNRYNFKQAD